MHVHVHVPCVCQADRQTCREEQSIHTVLCVLLSAVYEYRNTYMYVRIYMYVCTRTLPYNKVGRLPMAGSNRRMVTDLEGDSEGGGGKGNGEN